MLVALKSQSSLEYIVLLGWVLLVILITAAAFNDFEITGPKSLMPKECSITPNFFCVDFKVAPYGITVALRNGYGYAVENITVFINECGTATGPTTMQNGQVGIYQSTCAMEGSRFEGKMTVEYIMPETKAMHTLKGSIITNIEGG